MPAQNNSGLQFDKDHAYTVIAATDLAVNRLVAYDGGYATSAGGVKDLLGVSEFAATAGQAVSVVDENTYLVEASVAVAYGDYIKPAADGTGRAAIGSISDQCGRAMGAATAAGQLFEMRIVQHVHA